MKMYYLFPSEGEPVKIEKDTVEYKITLNNSAVRFTKEKLVEQLTAFLKHLEKYDKAK